MLIAYLSIEIFLLKLDERFFLHKACLLINFFTIFIDRQSRHTSNVMITYKIAKALLINIDFNDCPLAIIGSLTFTYDRPKHLAGSTPTSIEI